MASLPKLASVIHGKTEGNALFVSAMMHYLRDQGVIAIEQERWMLARPIPDFEAHSPNRCAA